MRQMEFEGQDTKKRKLCRGEKIPEICTIDLLSLEQMLHMHRSHTTRSGREKLLGARNL